MGDSQRELHELVRQARAHVEELVQSGVDEMTSDDPAALLALLVPGARPRPKSPPNSPPKSQLKAPPETQPKPSPPPVQAPAAKTEPARPADPAERRQRLAVLADEVRTCTRCRLHEGRTQAVFARGSADAEIVFVGEGPGYEEDKQGLPFVGPAGQLLDRMVAAMGYDREEVYVANVIKCRPPENRKPQPDEIAACMPYLREQLALIDPKVIVALGATGVEGMLGSTMGITRMRGTWKTYKGRTPIMPTFHPAYLLRSPEKKREVWEDLKAVLKQLGKEPPPQGRPGERHKKRQER